MRSYYLILMSVAVWSVSQLHAQYRRGVVENDYARLQTLLDNIYGQGKYGEFDIMNIDSTKNPGSPEGIEDPYGTLKGCYVFLAEGKLQPNEERPKGFIGIMKNGQIIWKSDTLVNCEDVVNAEIRDIRELNQDGKVDIVTIWQEGNRGDIGYLWIFSWDGHSASVINDIDGDHRSKIVSVADELEIVDLDGDGIKEITAQWRSETDPSVLIPITYSWNGQMYGKWSNPPQPPSDGSLPKNKMDVVVRATVSQDNSDSFLFSYAVENKQTSLQKLAVLVITKLTNNIVPNSARVDWEFDLWRTQPAVLGWNDDFHSNLIAPGDIEKSFSYMTSALPKIASFYAQGYNGETAFREIFTNSVQGKTLGPADSPSPFIPLVFLDSLISYKHQALALGWIDNQGIANSLDQKLESVRNALVKNNKTSAKNILQAFVNEVEAQKDKHLSSEAYALLKFNAEYLISKL